MTGKPNEGYTEGTPYYITVCTEPVSTDGYSAPAAQKNIGSNALDAAKAALGNLGDAGYYSPVRAGHHDIVPFRKKGMPALTLSWRMINYNKSAGADYGLAESSICHDPCDNIANFDMNSLYNTTRLAANAVARLLAPYMKWDVTLPTE